MEDVVMTDDTKKSDETTAEKSASPVEKKRKEPTSEILENFSRVTPAQLAHISFPPDARFQPVRSFTPPIPSTKARRKGAVKATTERYAGGGIIMLVDRRPGEETKFVDLPPELGGDQPPTMVVDQEPSDMMLDTVEEAEMPESFEVCSHFFFNIKRVH
jgi:26S proteasome regulatory subunit N2